jgi:hypothetical protein
MLHTCNRDTELKNIHVQSAHVVWQDLWIKPVNNPNPSPKDQIFPTIYPFNL